MDSPTIVSWRRKWRMASGWTNFWISPRWRMSPSFSGWPRMKRARESTGRAMALGEVVINRDLMAGVEQLLHTDRTDVTPAPPVTKTFIGEKLLGRKVSPLNVKTDFGVSKRRRSDYQWGLENRPETGGFPRSRRTLIEDRDYLRRAEEVVIFPGVAAALKQLQEAGFIVHRIEPVRGRAGIFHLGGRGECEPASPRGIGAHGGAI